MGTPQDEIVGELTWLHRRLRETITDLPADLLDRAPGDGANSIAVILTHTLGSEASWLHRAAGRDFTRDRDGEFRVRGRGREELLRLIDQADGSVGELVRAALADGLEAWRERADLEPRTVAFCLAKVISHLAEHVGHAELTRQLLIGGASART